MGDFSGVGGFKSFGLITIYSDNQLVMVLFTAFKYDKVCLSLHNFMAGKE